MAKVTANQSSGMTVAQYLSVHGIQVAPLDRDEAARLGVVAVVPVGWEVVASEKLPGATAVLIEPDHSKNGFTPNAVLLVGKLSAAVDSADLLDCSFIDAQVMPGWIDGGSSSADVAGSPSRFMRGAVSAEGLELEVTSRYALVDDQFLVQLTVTILAEDSDKLAFDVSVINDGLLDSRR